MKIDSIDFHNEDEKIKATRYMRKVFEYHEVAFTFIIDFSVAK